MEDDLQRLGMQEAIWVTASRLQRSSDRDPSSARVKARVPANQIFRNLMRVPGLA